VWRIGKGRDQGQNVPFSMTAGMCGATFRIWPPVDERKAAGCARVSTCLDGLLQFCQARPEDLIRLNVARVGWWERGSYDGQTAPPNAADNRARELKPCP